MLATVHALVGAAIGLKEPDPAVDAFLVLTSHFIMDSIPHWDLGTHWRSRPKYITGAIAIADTLLGITVAYLLFRGKEQTPHLLFSVVLSLLPDWLESPWHIFFSKAKETAEEAHIKKHGGMFEKIAFTIYKWQSVFHNRAEFPFGILTQFITLAFFFLLLR